MDHGPQTMIAAMDNDDDDVGVVCLRCKPWLFWGIGEEVSSSLLLLCYMKRFGVGSMAWSVVLYDRAAYREAAPYLCCALLAAPMVVFRVSFI